MNATFAPYTPPGYLPISNHNDALFDEITSSHRSMSRPPRRHSRGSSSQRSGSAMRVVKPSSASNSPRSTSMSNRRRTMIVEGMTPRRPQLAADYLAAGNRGGSQQPSGRPVSWHPSTYAQMPLGRFQQQQPHANNYPLSTPAMYNDHQEMYYGQPQFSPMLTSYSNNTSPASSFSPLPFGHQGADGTPYGHFDGWGLAPKTNSQPLAVPNGYATTMAPRQLEYDHTAAARSGLDWNQFIIHGFNSTSPPDRKSVV